MRTTVIIFDFAGTLVRMRPAKLLLKRDLLEKLSESMGVGIVTGARKAETNNIISTLGLDSYSDFVITKDDSAYQKPDKRLWRELREKTAAERIIYVGDTQKDYIFSKNLGVKFCYVGKKKLGRYQSQDVNQVVKFIVEKFSK